MAKKAQNHSFIFNASNMAKAEEILLMYPKEKKQSAVMPLLHLAQEQNNNWLSIEVMNYIALFLEMPAMRVYEIAHFYSMYNTKPVGKKLIQVCRTTPCYLRGAEQISEVCKKMLDIEIGDTTVDQEFTLVEVECLGACVNAPVVQINNDYYEDLSEESMKHILEELMQDNKPAYGSALNRQGSAPLKEKSKNAK